MYARERRVRDLGPPDGTPERRKPGRPRTDPSEKPITLHVKVSPRLANWVYRKALSEGIAGNAIIRALIEQAALGGEV